MSRSETQITWMAENVLSWETVSGHITQRDLNRYYLLDVYLQAHFSDYVLLPGWFSEHSHLARPEKRDFIASLKRFLLSYRPAGRLTIFRYLNMFFIWQSVNQYDYGTAEGVEMYIKHLMNDIRRRKISVRMARHYLSVVNRFLLTGGQIQRRYEYEFLPKGTYQQQGRDSYTRNELSEILRQLSSMNEFLAGCIREHIAKSEKGVRHFSPSLLAPVYEAYFRYPGENGVSRAEIIIRDVLENYFLTSFFLFCYHTWGNTSQVLGLTRDDIHLDEKGISTDYVYKGRANKYIRLTIGKSEYVTKRAGYYWFLSFIRLRDDIVNYLVSADNFPPVQALFLSEPQVKFRKLYSLNPSHLTKFSNSEGAWATMRQLNPSLPSITVSGLRKTSEQYTDRTLKNGLITAEKAQHNWGTYRRNYAAGNPQGAKENFSAALDTLMNQGIATRALSERVKVADELGIDLRGSDEGVDLLLNGLGCRSQEPPTDIELRFIKKQKRFGRTPKACADFSHCVECSKSCVVETLESVWLLLSFRHAIEYGKPLYIGSVNAVERYETLLLKIDLRLGLVDEATLKKARVKLQREGVAPVFGVTIGALYQRRAQGDGHIFANTFLQYVTLTISMGAISLMFESAPTQWSLSFALGLGWLVIGVSVLAIMLLIFMIRSGEATKVATYFYLVPILTAAEAWLLFGEAITLPMLVGMAVTIIGLIFVIRE